LQEFGKQDNETVIIIGRLARFPHREPGNDGGNDCEASRGNGPEGETHARMASIVVSFRESRFRSLPGRTEGDRPESFL